MAKTMKVLLPPGMGDIHWCILKISSLMQKFDCNFDLCVWNADGKKRVDGYMQALSIPGARWAGYYDVPATRHQSAWDALYHKPGSDILGSDVCEHNGLPFDLALGFNSSLEHGHCIREEILNSVECDFNYALAERPEDAEIWREFLLDAGQYVLFQWHSLGHYGTHWMKHFGEKQMCNLMRNLHERFKCKCVMVGLGWDAALAEELATWLGSPEWLIDLTTHTTTGQLMALQRRAKAFVSFASGGGIIATHLRTPTVMLWAERWPSRHFADCWCPPGYQAFYTPLFVEDQPNVEAELMKLTDD